MSLLDDPIYLKELLRQMHEAEIDDVAFERLLQFRIRAHSRDLEQTVEQSRLEFGRRIAERGAIGRGDRYPTLETIRTIEQTLDFAGEASQRDPRYSG